ncbi:MAG: peptide-binding protein [Rhodobacter sp.]|nr:peptide-binding protein [Rhodobacter sp.]
MRTALAVLLILLCPPALAQPGYFRVTGVAADDTLNVRAGPSAGSSDIGDLPPDARGIEVAGTDASGKWGRIVWEEANGWIAMRFLAPDPVPTLPGTALPAGLLCAGTEPFWSLRLSPGSASFSDITGAGFLLGFTGALAAEGSAGYPLQLSHAGGPASSQAIIRPAACTDGMSDRTYPWTVAYLLDAPGGQRFLAGCCRLPLDIGFH